MSVSDSIDDGMLGLQLIGEHGASGFGGGNLNNNSCHKANEGL